MSSRGDQYTEETYRAEDDRRNDEPYAEEGQERRSSYLPGFAWGWWPSLGWGGRGRDYSQTPHEPEPDENASEPDGRAHDEDPSGGIASYWDEGLITLLIVGGAILFLFPEPVTSGIGILLLGLGVLAWAIDWAT